MKKKLRLWHKVIIGMILGILFGVFGKDYAQYLQPFGEVFLNMIKMVVVPLILFSILNGITNVSDASTFGRLGTRAFLIYMFTTAFAVTIGLTFANIFEPGLGLTIDLTNPTEHQQNKSLKDLFVNIIPSNPIKAMADGRTLQIVVFAFFTGFALILIGDKGREVKNLITSCTHLVFKMIQLVIQLTPYGVFAIMSWVVADYGIEVMLHLGKFILVVLGALFVQYILFGVMLLVIARINPLPFFSKMLTTQALALATSSSKATLPTAISELRNKVGVSKGSASFILPLGAAVNMDATAIYLGICAVFFAQIFGINLDFNHYIILILTATIGSIGAAGFPGGSMVMMGMVLSSVGLPLEGIGVILGIDRLLEMVRTMINITGDCTVTLIVDKMEGTFNKKTYYSKIKDRK
ncbi:dicarboxylate/amino acid:cation symporter [Candidatus Aquarickettsia rohweri]|uniref:Dicarboxylate/amino acid:cation symporter n=1 Tax=Candidatus Aquarickettsia rohweri TaxID=2602574 RepID=A0A429XKL7_9RICK|nr:dicarboxylate/amino acid:cation symporter [Candidatus Aquarickettsia rohweri]MSO14008.1 Proton/sodium-glutamate symport protein [Rickettsiales endosymbiont of Trichoplax sp. H2]RST66647.1 dicarboxylate/amino acid:cation symporter [Candidatus Aquarickettsia rohweri]